MSNRFFNAKKNMYHCILLLYTLIIINIIFNTYREGHFPYFLNYADNAINFNCFFHFQNSFLWSVTTQQIFTLCLYYSSLSEICQYFLKKNYLVQKNKKKRSYSSSVKRFYYCSIKSKP